MGVSGPQVSLPDLKSPALGHLMSWDAGPRAGQQWAEGGPTHLLAPQVQSAQGQQGRGLPAGRAEESSGTKWAPWRMAERRAALHFRAGLMSAAPIRPRAPLRRATALPGPSHRTVRCPALPIPPLAPTPVQEIGRAHV